jgi:hypothetical protein
MMDEDVIGNNTYLFDIEADPNEMNNLYDAMPDVANQLRQRLIAYRENVMADSVFCEYTDSHGVQAALAAPLRYLAAWVTDVEQYTCPVRTTKAGLREKNFSPVHISS